MQWWGHRRHSDSQLSALGSQSGSFLWSHELARIITTMFWPQEGECLAPVQSELTLENCASLQGRRKRVFWRIHSMKYKRDEERRIFCLLNRHFPLSNIAGYHPAQTRSCTVGMFKGVRGLLKRRKRGGNSWQKKLSLSLASCSSNIYWSHDAAHWPCEGRNSNCWDHSGTLPPQLAKDWKTLPAWALNAIISNQAPKVFHSQNASECA